MHYYPILKAKQGEIQALRELKQTTKPCVRPILQVPPPTMSRPQRGEPSVLVPNTSTSVRTCINRLKNISDLECFVDPTPGQLSDELLVEVVELMGKLPSKPWPLLELEGSDRYLDLYRFLIGEPEGYCLRLTGDESVNATVANSIQRALRHYKLAIPQGVLLLDMGDVSLPVVNTNIYASNAIKMFGLTSKLPFQEQVLASGAFPASFPATAPSWAVLPYSRRDAELWQKVRSRAAVSYGDFGISNPSTAPMPSYSGSPKARYTHDTEFKVIKGEAVGPHPLTMLAQYHRISKILTASGLYSGPSFSWGDAHITDCCDPASLSNGNLTTWVAVNTNHHIEFVVNQLGLRVAAGAIPSAV